MRLLARDVSKSFGPTRALDAVTLSVREAAIHALLGENGAGKSTLMKILAGAERADSGTLMLDDQVYAPRAPSGARARGVAIVYQELSLCPDLTVLENVLLGVESHRLGWISRAASEARVRRAFEPMTRSGRPFPLDARVAELSTAEHPLVELGRALAQAAPKLVILDEPTSALGHDDVERLFAVLRSLQSSGLSVVYISHFLEEVRRIADDYTVLRDGRSVERGALGSVSNEALVASMAGESVGPRLRRAGTPGATLLTLRALAGERLPVDVSLELKRGEVLGIAGLVGSGRTELLRAVFALDRVRSGEVRVGAFSGAASPQQRLRQGIGLLSEDRKGEGLATALPLAHNLTLSRLQPLRRRGFLSPRAEHQLARAWVTRLGIRCRDVDQPVGELSGGNQQKVALARLLYHDVEVLLLDEPTRGIDVRSRQEVHQMIDALCAKGKAVLLISSQFSELLAVCDRIAILQRGVLGPARPVAELDEASLLLAAGGA
ncbi:MAG TPA: sugar ABC transporter ATP-binding protein [Polyangiaceae bacterium]|nr:sugar ABC transporter ATP-binding protein [Polyangiaceae bacterium]